MAVSEMLTLSMLDGAKCKNDPDHGMVTKMMNCSDWRTMMIQDGASSYPI